MNNGTTQLELSILDEKGNAVDLAACVEFTAEDDVEFELDMFEESYDEDCAEGYGLTVYVNDKMVANRVRITSEEHLHSLVVKYHKAAKRTVRG